MLATDLGADIFDNPKAIGHAEPGTSLMMHIVPHGMRMDLVEEARKTTEFAGLDPQLLPSPTRTVAGERLPRPGHELTPNGAMANPDGVGREGRGGDGTHRRLRRLCSSTGFAVDVRTASPPSTTT